MAVFPDRIVLKNSTDGETSIVEAITSGGTDAITPGELVISREPGAAGLYTVDSLGSIVKIAGGGGSGGEETQIEYIGVSTGEVYNTTTSYTLPLPFGCLANDLVNYTISYALDELDNSTPTAGYSLIVDDHWVGRGDSAAYTYEDSNDVMRTRYGRIYSVQLTAEDITAGTLTVGFDSPKADFSITIKAYRNAVVASNADWQHAGTPDLSGSLGWDFDNGQLEPGQVASSSIFNLFAYSAQTGYILEFDSSVTVATTLTPFCEDDVVLRLGSFDVQGLEAYNLKVSSNCLNGGGLTNGFDVAVLRLSPIAVPTTLRLGDLYDVDLISQAPLVGQAVVWDGGAWVPGAGGGGGSGGLVFWGGGDFTTGDSDGEVPDGGEFTV